MASFRSWRMQGRGGCKPHQFPISEAARGTKWMNECWPRRFRSISTCLKITGVRKRWLRQADCVAARPAAGCSRLQSFIYCGPTIPQVWPDMSSADLEARRAGTDGIHGVRLLLGIERSKGKRRNPFHGRGRAAKGQSCGFFDNGCRSTARNLDKRSAASR